MDDFRLPMFPCVKLPHAVVLFNIIVTNSDGSMSHQHKENCLGAGQRKSQRLSLAQVYWQRRAAISGQPVSAQKLAEPKTHRESAVHVQRTETQCLHA